MFISVGAVIGFQDKYLLQLRDNKPDIYFPNHWGLFGGATENNESPTESIKREIFEEISLEINDITSFLTLTIDTSFFDNIRKRIFFRCDINNPDKIILREGKKYDFFEFDKIRHLNIVPFDFAAISFLNKNI